MISFRRGFSILEIMVVVAIVAFMSTIGHSAYQNFYIRARVTEAINVLDEYQAQAMKEYARTGELYPYYVLFGGSDTAGLISGAPGDYAASKQLDLKYVDMVTADTYSPSGTVIFLLGARLRDAGDITTGANFVYMRLYIENGVVSWQCGASSSKSDNIPSKYLPATCQNQF